MARILASSRSAVRFVAAPYNWRFNFQVAMEGVANPAMTATTARAAMSSITENPQDVGSRRIQVPSMQIRVELSEFTGYTTNRRWRTPSK